MKTWTLMMALAITSTALAQDGTSANKRDSKGRDPGRDVRDQIGRPDEPGKPGKPGKPKKPGKPDKPGKPGVSPGKPGKGRPITILPDSFATRGVALTTAGTTPEGSSSAGFELFNLRVRALPSPTPLPGPEPIPMGKPDSEQTQVDEANDTPGSTEPGTARPDEMPRFQGGMTLGASWYLVTVDDRGQGGFPDPARGFSGKVFKVERVKPDQPVSDEDGEETTVNEDGEDIAVDPPSGAKRTQVGSFKIQVVTKPLGRQELPVAQGTLTIDNTSYELRGLTPHRITLKPPPGSLGGTKPGKPGRNKGKPDSEDGEATPTVQDGF